MAVLSVGCHPLPLSTQAGLGESVAVDLYKICVKYGKPRWNYTRGLKKAAILSSWVRKREEIGVVETVTFCKCKSKTSNQYKQSKTI